MICWPNIFVFFEMKWIMAGKNENECYCQNIRSSINTLDYVGERGVPAKTMYYFPSKRIAKFW